jgi:hypothetical protein
VSRPTRAAVSLSLLVLCVACDSLERESAYATHADAVADDAILRGWIPPFVPESAREIREIHDLDTNEVSRPTTRRSTRTPTKPRCLVGTTAR